MIAICSVHKWESPWLNEWLTHHASLGVVRFDLWSHEDGLEREKSRAVLRPWVQDGLVMDREVTGDAPQLRCFNQTLEEWKRNPKIEFGAFIDIDEFLIPQEPLSLLLSKLVTRAALSVNWVVFGSSGHVDVPPSVLRCLTGRPALNDPRNRHVKLIVHPSLCDYFTSPHEVFSRSGTYNELGKRVNGPFSDFSGFRIRLHHYHVRCRNDFLFSRMRRGRVDLANADPVDDWAQRDINTVHDSSAERVKRCYLASSLSGLLPASVLPKP